MTFVPHTDQDKKDMLTSIGVNGIEDLFDEIPEKISCANIDAMPHALNENQVTRLLAERAPNHHLGSLFAGAGAYEHFIPAAVWELVSRGEFYTAYTPYQPEASQGTLQVIYEYQTMMTAIMAMEVSNASLYDGASALAEAVLMALRIQKNKKSRILVPSNLHPHYRAVLNTILSFQSIQLIFCDDETKTGCIDFSDLKNKLDDTIAAVIVSQPNFFGCIEAVSAITNYCHDQGALVIALVNPIAMNYLTPPGEWGNNGADIACGEGQPLGVPLAGGGPYFGFLCCRKKDIRQLPGRLVGKTKDKDNRVGYVLTLQAREQHIRRSKATSNICTNQGLLVTAATIYMRLLGAAGMHQVSKTCFEKSNQLKQMLSQIKGVAILFDAPTFHEFVIQTEKPIDEFLAFMKKNNVHAGVKLSDFYPAYQNCLLICVTETKTDEDLERFIQLVTNFFNTNAQVPGTRYQVPGTRDSEVGVLRKIPPAIPTFAELDVVRHFTRLSQRNFAIDVNFYPLGSCTMKYNPRAANVIAKMPGYLNLHPLCETQETQGHLENLYELQQMITTLTGFSEASLTPMAGAQGEFAGVAMIAAYHRDHNDLARTEMLIPDAAHGTNPASARMCGFEVKEIPTCLKTGDIDLEALRKAVGPQTAGIMLTNPSTLGVFEKEILTIAKIVHDAGGLLYYDGANLNAILGYARPGDMGFDVMHLNCHKTFATPHGGGGPGAGPVAANKKLAPYLPTPIIGKENNQFVWLTKNDRPKSIGRLSCFMGNTGVLLRAHVYLRLLGKTGAKRVSELASLNANYLMKELSRIGYVLAFPKRRASHEFIITIKPLMQTTGVTALDIAKRLLDFGIHAPTIYFPLLVPECMLIEPTETESKKTLDYFLTVMKTIYDEAHANPAILKNAPYKTPVGRLDEVLAARELDVRSDSHDLAYNQAVEAALQDR